jgi:pimeloyl-ACP methyl ester carboxylesterase
MFVLESGDAESPRSVLFLHALGLDHEMWQPQLDGLSDSCLLLVADLPGFARSRSEQPGLRQAAESSAAVLRERDLRPVVVGVSYGGYVATVLAATHPKRISGLAISGVRTRVPAAAAYLQTALFRLVRPRLLAHGASVSREALAAEKTNLIAATRELATVDLAPFLPQITAPTIVFAPEHDRFVRRGVSDLAAAIPTARVVPLADSGHLWTQAQPQPLIDAILQLLPGGSSSR